MSGGEILLIVVVILLLFGSDKILNFPYLGQRNAGIQEGYR